MSSAALAKKRRANINPTPPQNQSNTGVGSPPVARSNVTLPQLMTLFDKRITTLERRSETNENAPNVTNDAVSIPSNVLETDENLKGVIEEYEARFEMLVTQFNEMKEMLLKLQSYTMDVNKQLLEKTSIVTSIEDNNMNIVTSEDQEQLDTDVIEDTTEDPPVNTIEEDVHVTFSNGEQ